jgi:hypothetical protein
MIAKANVASLPSVEPSFKSSLGIMTFSISVLNAIVDFAHVIKAPPFCWSLASPLLAVNVSPADPGNHFHKTSAADAVATATALNASTTITAPMSLNVRI